MQENHALRTEFVPQGTSISLHDTMQIRKEVVGGTMLSFAETDQNPGLSSSTMVVERESKEFIFRTAKFFLKPLRAGLFWNAVGSP